MPAKKFIIIGAGLGGMALAARLARDGHDVEIYEKNASVGGRAAVRRVKGYTIDLGPTFMLMPHEFEELFSYCGKRMEDYFSMQRLDPCYRLHYAGGTHLDFHSALPEMLQELKRYDPTQIQGYLDFLAYHQQKYRVVYENFITKPADSLRELVLSPHIWDLLNLDGFISMWDHTGKFFSNEKLRLGFCFQSMYLGESPLATPGTYSMIPFVELTQGVWFPTQGIQRIVESVEKLAKQMGVQIHCGHAVKEILFQGKEAKGIRLADGKDVYADAVVSNLDLPAAYSKLIPTAQRQRFTDKKLNSLKYSCSAFMLYLGVDKDYSLLKHHNIFFSADYLKNFKELFETNELTREPSFYVNVSTHSNPKLAPRGKHLLGVLVPVPVRAHRDGKEWDWDAEKKKYAEEIIAWMEKNGFEDLREHIEMQEILTPNDWEALAGMHLGSTFGLSPIFLQSSVFRPKQKSEEFENLYFVGASTHPGGGMPMVLISARTCQQVIQRDARIAKN